MYRLCWQLKYRRSCLMTRELVKIGCAKGAMGGMTAHASDCTHLKDRRLSVMANSSRNFMRRTDSRAVARAGTARRPPQTSHAATFFPRKCRSHVT